MPDPLLHVTPYGRAAAEVLAGRIAAAKADDPLHPVSVLVPTNYVGVSTRRLLASGALGPVTARGHGIAGLTLLTVYRLAELLGAPALAASGRRPVSTPLLGAVVRAVLRDRAGMFAPVVDHPSTEQALVRAHGELSELTPAALARLAGHGGRVQEVVRIHRAVRERLVAGWYEEADLMAAAEEAVAARAPVLDDLGTVLVHLPQDLSLPEAALLRTLAGVAPVEVVAAMTGVPDADADVVRSLERLGVTPPAAPAIPPPVVDEVVSVSDAEEEVRSALDRVLAAARGGTPLERMAIVYPNPEPYARIAHEQLEAAGIAWNGAAVRPLADRVVGRWLLDLLELPGRDFSRPAVMGLLTSAPVVGRTGRWLPAGSWERITRDAGVVRGRDEWVQRLERYAGEQERRAEEAGADPDAPTWVAERSRDDARRARDLVAAVRELTGALGRARRLGTWSGLAAWCRGMLDRWIERRRVGWPDDEVDAAERVDAALDRLAGLDAAEPATDLETFRRALAAELDDDLGRVGELGRGVLVGLPSAVLGVDVDLVVALGLAEGVTPTRPREDSLLPDVARRRVAAELRPRDERAGLEHRHLLAALAGAREHRVLIHPRGDLRRSTGHAASRWLLDAAEQLGGDRSLPARAAWLDVVPSFAGRMRRTPFPVTPRQHALRTLAQRDGPLHRTAPDPALRRAARVVHDRSTGVFGPFTGRLSPHAAGLVAGRTTDGVFSASALEQWLECPHAYLVGTILRVRPVENPEELLSMPAMDQGSLVHDVLDRWLADRIAAGVPASDEPWTDDAVAGLRGHALAALELAERSGGTGHPLLWGRDRARLLADLTAFVARDEERRRAEGLRPHATELSFGGPADVPELCIDLDDGRVVRIRGRIDRIDVATDGTVFVADYKTGRADGYSGLSPDDPLGGNTRLQLPIYALAVRDDHADAPGFHTEYWFISSRGRGRRIGYRLTDATIAALRGALRVVVDGIGGGLFPMRPPAGPSYGFVRCRWCDPDGLGAAEEHRAWERIRLDPALRTYVAAVEPDALAAAGIGTEGVA